LSSSGAIQESAGHEAPANQAARPTSQAVATPVHDLNVPYVATEEYEAPSNDMPFSRVWLCCLVMSTRLWFSLKELHGTTLTVAIQPVCNV
jgi:hypothetical protein